MTTWMMLAQAWVSDQSTVRNVDGCYDEHYSILFFNDEEYIYQHVRVDEWTRRTV